MMESIREHEARDEASADHRNLLDVPVAPISIVNDIAERFRQSVVNGTLRPGDEINESQLAERLGVARGTLREAVRILIGEGLLEKLPNRASRVRMLTPETAWEILTTRAVIEGFGARVLAQRLTPEKLQRLNAIWEHLYNAAEIKDIPSFVHWDFRLHQAIMELSGHGVLFETWTKISAWTRLMFAYEQFIPEDMVSNALNHKAIIEAIATGDPDIAEAKMKADLSQLRELERFAGLAELIAERRAATA
jgi:DNA-binding GntR family transcriptional regulator